jgi:ABC-type multidrug transport system permease subunit
MFLPTLMVTIFYFAVNLFKSGTHFFLTIACSWLCAWMGSAYGLLLSTAFEDAEVSLSLVPVLVIPLMLIGGLYAPIERVPKFFTIFEYISTFYYHFQTLIHAQFNDKASGFTVNLNG